MAERITVEQARHDLDSPAGTLLVCGYDDDAKFAKYRIEEAIPLSEFRTREASIPKDREIIFYCA